ncbi:UvrD-helicase domain-containing protein [Bacteroides thetaiotaomicron]|uniref:UvrD-helicase domain-containing protein n=1 Tax=Bacteroidales TaxID=171549 RepID=UPI00189B7618|nr:MULTISPECIES: UvrD-helicase domain-containing protein [Bacteroidales]MCR1853600.1 UvrD-helicase domain-containing protein [Parabacteroides distasonis]MCS3072915.1 UvrD-helicase domain-containing protein [Bacteroides thetaiotaomicron]MDC2109708.1 UvrD-helicase domain-containing protein [Bacteroides thetaiotaomicron]UVP30035.1 UvrD-helicase domain-containing protein [Bacteroides thetaiotaomicron]UVQ71058.1 UvrD-helicase domain-containing protein [Bacteroides thetaiotaomicron]
MQALFIGVICIIAISICYIVITRTRLKNKSKELSEKLNHISSYGNKSNYEQAKERLLVLNNEAFIDIPTDLNNVFSGRVISATQEKDFANHYKPHFQKSYSLVKKLKSFNITPSETISKFINDFGAINKLVKQHNEEVITFLLDTHKEFFDHCLKYPLDKQQRRSIVSEEENCLVVSSAGSGKTSSIVGKVKYLTEIKKVNPQNILLISYTNKAAAELTERMGITGLRGYTFHKLALDIIGQTTGQKPSIYEKTDALFVKIYHELLNDKKFKESVIEYFIDYQTPEKEWEKRKNERRQQLSEQKDVRLKASFPDMDGKTVYVRSEQEQKICFALSSLSVKFRYEEPYEHPLADEMHSQYKPDFSIYFEQSGKTRRVYLEHFGVDEHGLVPIWFAKDRGITYEEANQKYNDGITWKKAAHEKFGTELLTTSSADFHYSDIREKLKNLLEKTDVPIQEKTDAELYDMILPPNSKQEKAFIRLVVTFVTLIKSSCKSVDEVLRQTKNAGDERSTFIIKNIFQPVYKRYIEELTNINQIDFTDAILQATDICRSSHSVKYDYIIVDEFQDISVDRYNFLKVLREGNPPAKLYCVGDDWQSIYRFSGSDMALFNQFSYYFGQTKINKIETTYRFGEPLVSLSSQFIQRNEAQIKKNIHPFNPQVKTELQFCDYERREYCNVIGQLVASIPLDKSVFLLGRYSFDDYYLSFMYKSVKEGNRFFYIIGDRKIEFLTVHKSKGLEADYVIVLQCNKDTYGFPSLVSDDPVLNYVLTKSDQYPYGEERRLFYVAITRAKVKTYVLYDRRFPSVFVDEFLHPEKVTEESYAKHPNANKKWTRSADNFLLTLYHEGKSIKYIAEKMGRSQTSIVMRLGKLEGKRQ